MPGNTRHESIIEEETLYLEVEQNLLEVGEIGDVIELIGGGEYDIKYTNREAAPTWLRTNEDNSVSFNVRDTIQDLTFTTDFVTTLKNCPIDEQGVDGCPKRTELFAELLVEIWNSKGNIDLKSL